MHFPFNRSHRVVLAQFALVFCLVLITTGHECSPKQKPSVLLQASTSTLTLPCPVGTTSSTCSAESQLLVVLTSQTAGFDGVPLYTYTVTGGRVTGEGKSVNWDLRGSQPGEYTAYVEVEDRKKHVARDFKKVTVQNCGGCAPPCSELDVKCSSTVIEGEMAEFRVELDDYHPLATFTWSARLNTGTDVTSKIQEPGTKIMRIPTNGLNNKTITAMVEVGGLAGNCPRINSCSVKVLPRP